MDIKIIRATLENLDDINYIESKLEHRILSQNTLMKDLKNNNCYYFIALLDEKIVGYIGCSYLVDHIDILAICVLEEYRKKSIATKLLNEIINLAKKIDISKIFLEVRKSNLIAKSFYVKNGFKMIGLRKSYYFNPIEDAQIYIKDLV